MKKSLKILLVAVGSIVVLLVLASLVAPPIAKNYVTKHDKELLGREVSIEKIGVNLFSGKLKINKLTLFEEDGTTPFVRLDHLDMKIRLRDLAQQRLWVKHVLLSGLYVSVEQDHDWFNFSSLRERFSAEESGKASDFEVIINDAHIEKGCFRYADLALGSELWLRDIALQIPSIDFSDMKTDVGLDLSLSENATLHTDLRLSDNAKKYFINLKLNNLDIEVIEPYLQQHFPIDVMKGLVDMDVQAEGTTNHVMDFDLAGSFIFSDLAFQDMEGNPLGTVDSVFASIHRFNLNDRVLCIDDFHLEKLNTAYIIHADSSSNFDVLLGQVSHRDTTGLEQKDTNVSVDNEKDKSWNIRVSDFGLQNMTLAFEDHRLPQPFRYEITDISLSSSQFTPEGNNAVKLQAALNQVGTLRLNWQGKLKSIDNQNLTLMLNNVKMVDFSPYSVQWFGFPLENGTLSFQSQNVICEGNINGINKLRIAAPKVGTKINNFQPRYANIPLKLGLYLLADQHNNVSIDLPVSGNLHDPAFSYGKAIVKVFGNVLSKVVGSPFRLLMTDDDNNLKYIPFDPLQLDLSPEQYVMIDNLVATLQSRSDLGIVLEEQVQYEETVKQLCIMQLQRDYYLSLHPEMQKRDIDFITHEAIRSIKLNDKGLCDYAAQYSEKKRLRSANDVASVACAVYREHSEQLLPKMMTRRNELLSNYLLKIKGLSPEQISVTTIDASLLKSFTKSSRYEMHVFTYEDME